MTKLDIAAPGSGRHQLTSPMSRSAVRRDARLWQGAALDVFAGQESAGGPAGRLGSTAAATAAGYVASPLARPSTPNHLARLDADLARLDPARPDDADDVLARVPPIGASSATANPSPRARRRPVRPSRHGAPRLTKYVLARLRARVQQQRADAEGDPRSPPRRRPASRFLRRRHPRPASSPTSAGPSWFDRLLRRALEFLERLVVGPLRIERLSHHLYCRGLRAHRPGGRNGSSAPGCADAHRARRAFDPIEVHSDSAATVDSWRDSLNRAREAASGGHWRDAVRFVYWSGITHL